jgi:hypothetical protein
MVGPLEKYKSSRGEFRQQILTVGGLTGSTLDPLMVMTSVRVNGVPNVKYWILKFYIY